MFDVLSRTSENIFEQFKNKKILEEEYCKRITGLCRDQFFELSDFFVGINDNKHRKKYQLIAIYLYWLKTGMTQNNLALTFGKHLKQRVISRYLNQIRFEIHKDFGLRFLVQKRIVTFFLRYNTSMTRSIFSLDDDVLVLIADGTSCRIQKSNNNEFQYKTYSGQKKDSLFKPFIICCADGYILDCDGAFAANKNDSKILNYILENDEDLQKLLLPYKTLFLIERGNTNYIFFDFK